MKQISAAFVLVLVTTTMAAQTLDQRAYDAVWDRLDKMAVVDSDTERVHVLKYVTPATWGSGSAEGLRELQRIAGAIPSDHFRIDPSVRTLALHQVYASVVADIALPELSADQEAKFLAASARFQRAVDAAEQKLEQFEVAWEREVKDLERRKEPVTTLAKLRFRESKPNYFDGVQAELDAATVRVQEFRPIASWWVQAVEKLSSSMNAAMRGSTQGLWLYEASYAGLQVMKDCAADGPGWTKWQFKKDVSSERTRSGSWNANAAWDGAFFSIGGSGGGSEYSKVVTGDGESVSIGFCNLQYLPVAPGSWFDMGLLQALDGGLVQLKEKSPNYKRPILGSKGLIPRMVKGLIVARQMQIEARLSQSRLEEFRKAVSGSGGLRIGPFQIGGGGGGSEFSRSSESAEGAYIRSTDTTVPVIIAVVTETTGQ